MMEAVNTTQDFLELLWAHYNKSGRHDLPWRLPDADGNFDPYNIMVSELMLQQTQVARVIPKYEAFLAQFPTTEVLANVELGEVLRAWQGLGYNRRAKFLWQAAQEISKAGAFPQTLEGLVALPGVGKNTAGAIMAYAYNQPVVFIETNIRTVYLYHFFADKDEVSDKELSRVVAQTLDTEHPREFYWALMDYGSWLKTQVRNIAQSKHYVKQSKFAGSRRQIRGQVIRLLGDGPLPQTTLAEHISDQRLQGVLDELVTEHMIQKHGMGYRLA